MAMPESVIDARTQVVATIVEDMQKYQFAWVEQWKDYLTPRNAVSGRMYRGGNLLHLAASARRNNYQDPRWVSFKQAKENGWKIKKGSRAARIEFWKIQSLKAETEDGEVVELETFRSRPICLGTWSVFNGDCIEGLPPMEKADETHFIDSHLFNVADQYIDSSRCPIFEDDNSAFYSPTSDQIHLPNRFSFLSGQSFLRTLLHEMAHSTGHSSALDRDLSGRFGSESYAFEELIAELASAFVASDTGLEFGQTSVDPVHYENHVAYLQSWIMALKEDPNILFKAASKASNAADFILSRHNQA